VAARKRGRRKKSAKSLGYRKKRRGRAPKRGSKSLRKEYARQVRQAFGLKAKRGRRQGPGRGGGGGGGGGGDEGGGNAGPGRGGRRGNVTGVEAVKRRLRAIRTAVFYSLEAQLRASGAAVLSDSHDLAPQLTGLMIATSGVDVQSNRSQLSVRAVVFYQQRYALYQHEGYYNPGPITSVKLGPTYAIGRKFLQRALDRNRDDIVRDMGRSVERALRLTLR
jgi:hypothetical protein